MKPKVYITRRIPDKAFEIISKVCEVNMWEEEDIPVPYSELEKHITNVDGLYCLLTDQIDAALLSKAKDLRVISHMAVGFNNIDIAAATKRNILVTNTPGVLTETTADLTFTLLMAVSRRIVEASDFLRSGRWQTWSTMLLTGQDIHGARLGIIGLGQIGQALVKRAKGFDMNVCYFNRSRKKELEESLDIQYEELDALLQKSDYVCIMVPYTQDTKNLIGQRELSLMKNTAILINTARGGIVNEDDLYEALTTGEIWAAGLDVFSNEPLAVDHPLLELPNVVAIPHIGSASIRTREKMAILAAENLIKGLANQRPKHMVNPEVLEGG